MFFRYDARLRSSEGMPCFGLLAHAKQSEAAGIGEAATKQLLVDLKNLERIL